MQTAYSFLLVDEVLELLFSDVVLSAIPSAINLAIFSLLDVYLSVSLLLDTKQVSINIAGGLVNLNQPKSRFRSFISCFIFLSLNSVLSLS